MKKKVRATLLAALLATSTILSGCGAQETISMGTGGRPSGIHMSEGAKYQYQSVEPSDIIVEYSGLKPDCSLDKVDGTYLLDSSVYEGDTFGIYLDGEYFGTTIEEYVPYSDIQWAMVNNSEFWSTYGSKEFSGTIDTSMIEGKVIYADGSEMIIEPERVWGTLGGGEVDYKISVVYRDKVYEVSSPCPWLDWDMSGSDGEVADVSGSVVLNPEVSEGASSSSQASASVEGTVDEEFPTVEAFENSDLYKKIKALFAKIASDDDNEERLTFFETYGVDPYELWRYMPYYFESASELSGLHKLESVNTLGEFWVVYDELMSPYGRDLATLKAKQDAQKEHDRQSQASIDEAYESATSWYWDKRSYCVGGIVEASSVWDFSYESYYDDMYLVGLTVVIPDDVPSIPNGYSLHDLRLADTGDIVYMAYPKTLTRGDWGIPEEGTVISEAEYVSIDTARRALLRDWVKDNY